MNAKTVSFETVLARLEEFESPTFRLGETIIPFF